jgi:protein gp37
MTTTSTIEWTEQTWNPAVGCTKISEGCKNCCAEILAKCLKAMGTAGYEKGFTLNLLPKRLQERELRRKPKTYIVSSMSDLFHERVPDAYIEQIVADMAATPSTPTRYSPSAPNAWRPSSARGRFKAKSGQAPQ